MRASLLGSMVAGSLGVLAVLRYICQPYLDGLDGGPYIDLFKTPTGQSDAREMLNSLVNATVGDTGQAANLAFVKTHKTGSTTEAALFVRYAQRHGLTWAQYGGEPRHIAPIAVTAPKILKKVGRVDVMHYHMSTRPDWATAPWEVNDRLYRSIMRDPDHINYVTILREPREHLISWYYYFLQNKYEMSIQDFFAHQDPNSDDFRRLVNPSAVEFGIESADQVEPFFDSALSTFKLVMLTERFDEGLCLLRHLMGWHLIDIAYISSNESKKTNKPHFDDLPQEVQTRIDEMTAVDREIYERAVAMYEKTLAPLAREVEEDLAPFRDLQRIVRSYLSRNSTSLAHEIYDVGGIVGAHGFYPSANVSYDF